MSQLTEHPESYQLTEAEALLFAESGAWETMTSGERARFQIDQDQLCMPFGVFHRAVEDTLGRPVWTHELGVNREGLRAELLDGAPAPSIRDILGSCATRTRTLRRW